MARAPRIFDRIQSQLAPHVEEVRGSGCLIGVQLKEPTGPVIAKLLERGILVGGSGEPNTIRVMPALVASDDEIDFFTTTLVDILSSNSGRENAG
jgi:acetylornithine/succinyldiaminopimelate/putrescine aminotransferase